MWKFKVLIFLFVVVIPLLDVAWAFTLGSRLVFKFMGGM